MRSPVFILRTARDALFRAAARPSLAAWLALLWSFVLLVRGHALFIRYPHGINIDEGYILAMGQRLVQGSWLPYVDGVGHRGPMVYWAGAIVALFGEGWVPIRIAALLIFIVSLLFTFLAARAAGHLLAGAVGAVGTVIATQLVLVPHDGMAFNGEPVLNLFVVPAFWCLTCGIVRRERPVAGRWLAAAGALTMLGALSKQVAAFTFLPFGLWVLAAAFSPSAGGGRRRWRLLVFFVAGSALPLLLVVARYALAGELRTFWYWLVTYNVDVYMAPLKGVSRTMAIWAWFKENLVLMTLALTGVGWTLGRLATASLRLRSLAAGYLAAGFEVTVALTAVASVVGAHFGLRGFGHYYVQAVPWFALLAGVVAEAAREPDATAPSEGAAAVASGSRWLAVHHALVLLPMILVSELVWAPKRATLGPQVAGVKPPLICPTVQQYARPDEPVFIWGFYSEAHIWCRRKPATRYVLSTFVAGFVPWFHNLTRAQEDELQAPNSRAQLIAELEAGKTRVILDAHASMGHRPMRRYDELARYLDSHYRWVTRVDQVDVYLRGKRNRRELFDFEGPNLDPGWILQGDAFVGTGNIHHPPGREILGQVGQRFINSFTPQRGDAATGSAVSPAFRIDRTRLGFLIGGGRSCKVLLRIDGRDVLEQTGYDTTQFHDVVWDVSAYQGKEARLVLIDQATPIWGHLMLDRVELFDPGG